MRTAVDRIGSGKVRQVNARFTAVASHSLFEATFCSPASGWEKGQVEKNVQDARRQIWQAMPDFGDLPSLNAWLEARCIERWSEIRHGALPGSVAEVHARERASLMPVGRVFDGFVEHPKRVSPTCLVHFKSNRTSVRHRSPTGLSACGPTPTGSSWWPRGRSCASTSGSSNARTMSPAAPSTTGGTTWR